MKAILEIPNYEFDNDVKNKFQDYFNRVKVDIADGTLCGTYELETTDMFLASFKRLQVLPDNATNGDMIKAMFPQYNYEEINYKLRTSEDEWEVSSKKVRMHSEQIVDFESDWWNAPYKRGDSDGRN